MSNNCCSGNFSSSSPGDYLHHRSDWSCSTYYPGSLIYSTDFISLKPYQLDSSLHSTYQTCYEPTRCQTSCVVPISCQTSWYNLRPFMFPSPSQSTCSHPRASMLCSCSGSTYTESRVSGSGSCCFPGFGSRSCNSQDCGSQDFRSLTYRVCGFPSLNAGSRICRPAHFTSRSCQSSCSKPIFGYGFYQSAY
ncbi:keratin-associated protein 13-1-like [Sorex fumeus]|uniref:keratin-associated protein 13-1-like n=1 Tax=Sorex fumeus TaxID=62283 RepID=UPI0024ADB8E5|nr:keratin-associated protein 13-1-like [Sorex fumeus]